MVYLWQNVISLKSSETTEICDEVLWNNKHITCDGNSIYDTYLINKGIVKVGDIINETGRPLNWFEAKEKFLLHDSKVLSWLGPVNLTYDLQSKSHLALLVEQLITHY